MYRQRHAESRFRNCKPLWKSYLKNKYADKEPAVAGNSAASNLEGFVYMAMNAFYQATISFTSQNYGAREYRRIYRILLAGEIYVVATGVLLGNLMVFFGEFCNPQLQMLMHEHSE